MRRQRITLPHCLLAVDPFARPTTDAVGKITVWAVIFFSILMIATPVAAQSQKLSNVDLCNGKDRKSIQTQIFGCTALIKSNITNAKVLAIAHNNRGNVFASMGHYDLAIEDYTQSIKLNPSYASPLNNRGVAYRKRGEYDRAIGDFDAAITMDANYANAFANRAEVYQKKGDYTQAMKDLDEAIKLQPAAGTLWNERCWTHALANELEAALSDCNKAIDFAPTLAAAFDSRGFIHLKLAHWDLALGDFDSALRLDQKLASSLYGRGLAKIKRGDPSGGKTDISAAKVAQPGIVDELARYGWR